MKFVTSWDDGHPSDLKVAELLSRFGVKGTFFIPGRNREGLPVLDAADRRELHRHFEIGSHTLDHAYLDSIPFRERRNQIEGGKGELESQLGAAVRGFCYPGGIYDEQAIEAVKDAGFAYARTTENLRIDVGASAYEVPTTFQFYPHSRGVILRNFVRRGAYAKRLPVLRGAFSFGSWETRLERVLALCVREDRVLHVWGHSWELDSLNLWKELERFLKIVASVRPKMCTVDDVLRQKNGTAE